MAYNLSDPFDLDPKTLDPAYAYQWMALHGDQVRPREGWVKVLGKEMPDMPALLHDPIEIKGLTLMKKLRKP